ncbi:MAG: pseudouridine synthase [Flavipsychrobacter sp.]
MKKKPSSSNHRKSGAGDSFRDKKGGSTYSRGPKRTSDRSDDDRPKRSYGNRDDRPKRSYGDRDDRPKRSYGDRDDKPKRSYGDRDDKPKRSYGDRDDRPKRSYGDRDDKPKRSYGDRDDRPKRSYGDRDDRPKRSYGDRDDKPKRSYGDRDDKPKRSYGPREDGDRAKRPYGTRDGGDKSRPYGTRGGDDRPKRNFGDRDRNDKPRFEKKKFTDYKDLPVPDRSGQEEKPKRTSGPEDRGYGDKPKRAPRQDKGAYDAKSKRGPRQDKGSYDDKPKPNRWSDMDIFEQRTRRKQEDIDETAEQHPDFKKELPDAAPRKFEKKFDRGYKKSAPSIPFKKRYEDFDDEYDNEDEQPEQMPLNKYIAHSGECSRRDAAELVKQGKIKVNGELVVDPGYKVKEGDKVTMAGKKLFPVKDMVYILLNKPKGFITTTEDPHERKTVMDLVANSGVERLYPVGRLDRNTTGLLLMTNDGNLAQKLSHPSYEVKKVYQVSLDKPLTKADFDKIMEGLELEDGKVQVDEMSYLDDKKELGLEIHSGRNRIVRRIFESLGYEVEKLDRVMYAGLTKKNLPRSKWRFLDEKEIIMLKHFKS